MSDVKNILENLGFRLQRDGLRFYRTSAIYRGGDNPTAVRVNAKTGWFTDYVHNIHGSLADLTQLVLKLKTLDEAKSWLNNHQFDTASFKSESTPIIEEDIKYFPNELLDKLIRTHDYWYNRGISHDVIDRYKGGVAVAEAMANRYVFPVFDHANKIIGFAGRDLTNKKSVKWKLVAPKRHWIFPIWNLDNIQKQEEVILVESIGDHLALEQAGIKTSLVMFGINLNDTMLSNLIGLDPQLIIIGLNNDSKKNFVGQKSADDVSRRLKQFFNPDKIRVSLPKTAKDFGEMDSAAILNWYAETVS